MTVQDTIEGLLENHMSPISRRTVVRRLGTLAGESVYRLNDVQKRRVVEQVKISLNLYSIPGSTAILSACAQQLDSDPYFDFNSQIAGMVYDLRTN